MGQRDGSSPLLRSGASAGRLSMARGWNHLGASLLRHLGLDAGCPLEPVLCMTSAWQLLDSWTSQAPPWLRAPKECVPVNKAETALPVLTQPWKLGCVTSHSILLVTSKPQTHPDSRGEGRGPTTQWEEWQGLTVDQETLWGPSWKMQSCTQSSHAGLSPDHPLTNLTSC